MSPEQFKQAKQLFSAALEREPGERSAFLREACAGDEGMQSEVEDLLASYGAEKTAAEPIERAQARTEGDVNLAEIPEENIGPYRVLQKIGSGGMGVVYLAVRADETYEKKVAIKVVTPGVIGTQEILERFRYERRILATLDHPNIAKLLDGGATLRGLPYFAMDFVEGVRIDEYCESRDLPIAERVRLFRYVCSAVHYVHQNLVVHRDLKPGNILVTAEGVPKLLDFGISKLLGTDARGDLTQADCRPMTPGYASPEQVRGDPVTTASDVYSLGVILYQLLTGRSPYDPANDSPQAIMKAVSEQDPEKPSATYARAVRTPHEKRARELRGDLDNVTLKALDKDPQRRYASAEQLSEDLRRYLEGMPVSARRDTWRYRAAKFVGRHRAGVAAAALVVLSLAVGLVAALWQAQVAERERANAQRQFNDVRKLATSFLFEFHGAIQNLPGSTAARKLVVSKALEYLGKLAQQAGHDRGLARELAEAYLKVGDVQGDPYGAGIGDTKGAVESYGNALRISQSLSESDPKDSQARLYLARSHKSLGQVLPLLGQPSEGLTNLRKATGILEGIVASAPGQDEMQDELARTYQALGDLQGHSGLPNLGDADSALANYKKALAIYQARLVQQPNSRTGRRGATVMRILIADLGRGKRDSKELLNEYREALQTSISGADPANAEDTRLMATSHLKVGGALEEAGDAKAALEQYAKAVALDEALAKADPQNVQAGMALAIALRYTGDLQASKGDKKSALENYQKVLAILDRLAAAQPANVLVAGRRAEMQLFVAEMLVSGGRALEGRKLTAESLAITRTLAARPDATAEDLMAYASTFLTCVPADLREPATALAFMTRAAEKSGGRDPEILDRIAKAKRELAKASK